MHTAAKLALVLLAVAAVPAAGSAQYTDEDLTAIYDPAPRSTRVSVPLKRVARPSSTPTMNLYFETSHPDTVPARPMEMFELSLGAIIRHGQAPRFAGVDEGTLLVDDSVEIHLEGSYSAGQWMETVALPVSHSQALRLAAARSVQGRIGGWEFRLAPAEIARIGRLLAYARLDPAAPKPTRYTVIPPSEMSGVGRTTP
jgi:hypothetical protein